MNPELEKLVQYAITDGYITDKEKKVLYNKAQAMGFDTDELDLILEGMLQEKQNSQRRDVEKCPSCGQIMNGLSRVCPSCNYILHAGSEKNIVPLDKSLYELREMLATLQTIPKTGNTKIITNVMASVFTLGIYPLYKKFIKKESPFDAFKSLQEATVTTFTIRFDDVKVKYGADEKINKILSDILAEKDSIIRKRRMDTTRSTVFGFAIIIIAIVGLSQIPEDTVKSLKSEESAEHKTERFIEEKNIGKAKLALAQMEEGSDKDDYANEILDLEIDSLTAAGNFDDALAQANLIKDDNSHFEHRQDKIHEVLSSQVDALIRTKEFKKARERAELDDSYEKRELRDKIDIAEKINKK